MQCREAKELFLEALRKTNGMVWNACRYTGLKPSIHQKWMREDEEYSRLVHDITASIDDEIESQLVEKAKNGNLSAIKLYLTSKCKDRGYTQDPAIVNAMVSAGNGAVTSLAAALNAIPVEAETVPPPALPEAMHDQSE